MMRQNKWFLLVYLLSMSGGRFAAANPPARPDYSANSMSLQWTPLWQGVLCIIAGRYEPAIAICDKVLRSDPDDAHAYVLRGYAHLLRENEAQKAIADFSAAIRCDPDNAAIRVARAQAYRQAKDYERAIADCTHAIRMDPTFGQAYAWRARCYLTKRVIDKAIADYSIALRYAPSLAWARCGRAEGYRKRDESARALADLEYVLRDDPENELAHFNRCLVYHNNLREYDRVIAEASEQIRLDPQDPRWYCLRSSAYLAMGETAKGLRGWAGAVALKPEFLHFHCSAKHDSLNLGVSFGPSAHASWEDDSEERIAACTKRLADDPNNVAAYYERASTHVRKGNFKLALGDFDRIIRLDPADAEAYRQRGRLHQYLKEYAEAMDDLDNDLRLDPGNADYYVGRAALYTVQKQYDAALHDYHAALRIDPRIAVAHDYCGWMHKRRREYNQAVLEYSEALRLAPNDADTYVRRAWVRKRQGKYDDTFADFEQALRCDTQNIDARSGLAWFQATCPEASLRNGKKARENATIACQSSSWREPIHLDTLAAACAEGGDFEEAVKWQTKALELAPEADKPGYRHRLELYRSHRPYHQRSAKR